MRIKERTNHKQIFIENVSDMLLREMKGGITTLSSAEQLRSTVWLASVTDSTETEMYVNGVTDERYTVEEGSVRTFQFHILATDEDSSECKSWEAVGFIRRNADGDTILKSRVDPSGVESAMESANFKLTFDDTENSIKPLCYGIAGKNITFIMAGSFDAIYGA